MKRLDQFVSGMTSIVAEERAEAKILERATPLLRELIRGEPPVTELGIEHARWAAERAG